MLLQDQSEHNLAINTLKKLITEYEEEINRIFSIDINSEDKAIIILKNRIVELSNTIQYLNPQPTISRYNFDISEKIKQQYGKRSSVLPKRGITSR